MSENNHMDNLTLFDIECLKLAISLAEISRRDGGLPFGAVLAKAGEIKRQSIDRRMDFADPTAHAEMSVIREHCWQEGCRYLKGYTIYCSTEPCAMCSGAIRSAQISRVVYSVSQEMLQRFSGGISKGGCKAVLAASRVPIKIIGPALVELGTRVFDGYPFSVSVPPGEDEVSTLRKGERSFETRLVDWARRLTAIGRNGMLYAETVYHRERYEAVVQIAAEILADTMLSGDRHLRRLELTPDDYETPKMDVRGVVFRGDKLLFVKEADDQLWSLPGGWVEVGETPRQTVEKEVFDESGFRVTATRLLGVFDKDRHTQLPTSVSQTLTFFFACDVVDPQAQPTDSETTAYRFCGRNQIPELSPGRVPLSLVQRMFRLIHQKDLPTQFD
jgi:tRNA(Arg) A34 adenosine deaminase TadA/ADP-ribose pyrophosphatase YjhB (NUDIX family)